MLRSVATFQGNVTVPFKGQAVQKTVSKLKIKKIDRPETSVTINLRYVTSQKSEDLALWCKPKITQPATFPYHMSDEF